MGIKVRHKKGEYRLHMDYDKYEKQGDLHWQWYNDPKHEYRQLVDESLKPFENVTQAHVRPTIVDIGCGDGLPLSKLWQLGFKCYGVDSSETGIKIALHQHDVSAEFFIESAEKFAERNLSFDYLYCLNTIEHMDDPKALIKIMKHVNYFGIIITDNDDTIPPSERSVYHNIQFSPQTFEELFKDFQLERIEISNPKYFGYKVSRK